jgi:putative two-component system response regulator
MVTGEDDLALAEVALSAGAYGYVIKPFTSNEILIQVSSALRRRTLEIENRAHRGELVDAVRTRTEELWNSVRSLENKDVRLRAAIEETVLRLSLAAELRDKDTGAHIERVSRYAGLLAERAGLEPERCAEIGLASRLHDAGKISLPDRILRKQGKFTPEEFEIMKGHAESGYRLFAGSAAELLLLAGSIAWTHHERWDGSGYPRGLAGRDIPIEGRIAAIADVFDALMSKRPYKPAFPLGKVLELMREGLGTHFDPELGAMFIDSLDEVLEISSALRG